MKKSFVITLVLFFSVSHAEIKNDTVSSIIAANPKWHESKGSTFYIGFQCGNLFLASSNYLSKIKYPDQRLVNLFDYYYELFSFSSIRYSKDTLLINIDGMINVGNQIYDFYKLQIPPNFSSRNGQFRGIIKNDIRECLKTIKVFHNLPQITT